MQCECHGQAFQINSTNRGDVIKILSEQKQEMGEKLIFGEYCKWKMGTMNYSDL